MISVEPLLAPLSDESPCGENLSYDARLSALETSLRGQEESQFAAAQEPNWRAVQRDCVELFASTKDLRVAVALDVALLELDDLPGFAQGMELLRGLLEKFWQDLYPRLDPDDDNDPTERVNILAPLAAPEGTFGDPLRVVSRLKEVPLCRSVVAGSFSLAQILSATTAVPAAPAAPADPFAEEKPVAPKGIDPTLIQGAFRDTPPEFLEAQFKAVNAALDSVKAIDTFLAAAIGAENSVDFTPLTAVLGDIRTRLTTYTPALLPPGEAPAVASAAGAAMAGGGRGPSAPGTIGSRDDVIRAIDAICAYYDAQEPSSPVPALLVRAKELVGLGFLDILKVLTPDATPQVRLNPPANSGSDF